MPINYDNMSDDELNAALLGGGQKQLEQMSDQELNAAIAPQQQQDQQQTLEEQMGFNRFYSIADKLKYLDAPRADLFAGTAGVALDLAQAKNPYENINKQFSNPLTPQPESSFMGRLRQMFPEQKPIMDTPQQDVLQGHNIEAGAKLWAQQQFPKAYGFASNVVPSDIPGMLLDAATGELITPKAGITAEDLAQKASQNRATTFARSSSLPASESADMLNNLQYQKIANTLERHGVADQISNPSQLSDTLNGTKVLQTNELGQQKAIVQNPGLISQLTDAAKAHTQYLAGKPEYTLDANVIVSDVLNKLANESADPNSLVPMPNENQLQQKIESIVKPEDMPERNFQDLIDMKRNAADLIYEIKNNPETYGVQGPTEIKIHKGIWDSIDNYVDSLAKSGDPQALKLVQTNSDLSDMLNAKDILANAKLTAAQTPTALEAAGAMAAGRSSGHPMIGARPTRQIIGQELNMVPAQIANVQQNAANFLSESQGQSYPTKQLAGVASAVNAPNVQQQLMMRKGLVENLAEFQIPRNSQDILNNRQLVLAKIAQATNNPQIVDGLQDTLNMHPDMLKHALPALVLQFPNLFQPDYYNRVDGKIFSPDPMQRQQMIQKAYQDIENNSALSRTQKTMLQDGLNRDGSLPDSYK